MTVRQVCYHDQAIIYMYIVKSKCVCIQTNVKTILQIYAEAGKCILNVPERCIEM